MRYKCRGYVATFFRGNGNKWATSAELHHATGKSHRAIYAMLALMVKSGSLEVDYGEPRHYRMSPEKLWARYEKTTAQKFQPRPSVAKIQADFCKRYNVSAPFEATQHDPQAMREWCKLLGAQS